MRAPAGPFPAHAAFACGLLAALVLGFAVLSSGCGRGRGGEEGPPALAVSFDSLSAFPVPDPGAAASGAAAAAGKGEGAAASTGAAVSAGLARTTPAAPGTRPPGSSAFQPPPALAALPADPGDVLPPSVRALDGRRIEVRGYMVPVDFEVEGTNRFVLLRCTLACCYGKMPRVNDWIDVSVRDGRRVPYTGDNLVAVRGRFTVRTQVEGNSLVGLYWLEADAVEEAGP